MSAMMQPSPTKLEFPITRAMPRKLIVYWENLSAGSHIYAHAFIRCGQDLRSIAFGAAHTADEVRLVYRTADPTLWLRSAQFELTAAEGAEVERVFGPLGLTIDRSKLKS